MTVTKNSMILKNANLRCTPARLSVLGALVAAKTAITQQQIAKSIPEPLDKATIYRTLKTFIRANIAHKAFFNNRAWHFELAGKNTKTQCHPHFTCTCCQNTFCLKKTNLAVSKPPENFIIKHQKVLLEGICPQCDQKKQHRKQTKIVE